MGPRGPPGPSGAPVSKLITTPHQYLADYYDQTADLEIYREQQLA